MRFGILGFQIGVMTGWTSPLIEAVAAAAFVAVRTARQTVAAVAGLAGGAFPGAVVAQGDVALMTAASAVTAQRASRFPGSHCLVRCVCSMR